jgi:effector-binding domain-containing protein
MKILKYSLITLLSLIVIFFIIGLALDSKVTVTRSIEINAPAKYAFNLINNTAKWANYTDASLTAVEWMFVEKAGVTTVTWTSVTDFGSNYLMRYVGLGFDSMMGPDYETGLANIKRICEAAPPEPEVNVEVKVGKVISRRVLAITDSCEAASEIIAETMGKAYGEISKFMVESKLQFAGSPIAITHSWHDNFYVFDAAIPIASRKVKPSGRIKFYKSYQGKVVQGRYVGAYDGVTQAYRKIAEYININNLKQNGRTWEEYASDPSKTPENELVTIVYFPVK